jgi:2-amino-4-hydroxy-6-hydroxymethyldihydropteridine diphosphokinase
VTDASHTAARVAIALGANLGDRTGHLQQALAELSASVSDLRASSFHETAPVGVVDPQPNYLNAAAVGRTSLTPAALLARMLQIECQLGRRRPHANAARTIDLDLILYDDLVVDAPGLHVPHPRFRDRRFVLAPLAEIAPEMRDPVTGLTVAELLRRLGAEAGGP